MFVGECFNTEIHLNKVITKCENKPAFQCVQDINLWLDMHINSQHAVTKPFFIAALMQEGAIQTLT